MGTNELRKRDTWQDVSGDKAEKAEKKFKDIFEKHFENTDFKLRTKPREFKNIYSSVKLNKKVLDRIYNPDETWTHGIIPDFAIDNIKTKKTLYIEVKRQDGWVEGKEKKAGRENAHERSCKFFTPGLLDILRSTGKIGKNVLPFWIVFQGDIARDPKRVREIHFWYKGIEDHFFMWSDSSDDKSLIDHFENRLKKHLL